MPRRCPHVRERRQHSQVDQTGLEAQVSGWSAEVPLMYFKLIDSVPFVRVGDGDVDTRRDGTSSTPLAQISHVFPSCRGSMQS